MPTTTRRDSIAGMEASGSRGDLRGYVEGFVARRRAAERGAARYRERLRERLPRATRLLVEEFGASKVVLFGSLARGEATLRSDIDLLVDGLPGARLIDATVALERIFDGPMVDLVPFSLARPEIRERAEREGVVLHG